MAIVEANMAAFWALYGDAVPEVRRLPRDDLHAFSSPWTFGMLNAVCDIRLAAEAADAAIAEITDEARQRSADRWWFGGPSSQPADLGARLEAAGLTGHPPSPGMTRSLDGWVAPERPAGLETIVAGPEETPEYLDVLFAAFEFPRDVQGHMAAALPPMAQAPDTPLRNFVGRLNGQAVACASLLLADGVAGIWNVGVAEEARGQGLGTALTAAAMAAGAAAGAHTAILIATPLGEPVYRSMGFAVEAEMPLWSMA
jgi:ribosomal protein S18 acetylase RimI-like enzyme